ncbi:MAG: NTP transferase domain-containing protein [Acidimicrobiales bacterium]
MGLTLVVMAAGRGSRFGGMKQVAHVGPAGESLFDYAVYDALRSGFDRVGFVVSEASVDAVEAHVNEGCGRHVEVRYALQKAEGRAKPWGTGHAVLTACAEVDGAFGVVNADDFYGQSSFEMLGRELAADSPDHVLVGFRLRDSLSANGGVSRGLCGVQDGLLTSITELHEVVVVDGSVQSREEVALTGDELISANLWGFRTSFCRILIEEFDGFLRDSGSDPDAEFLIGDAVASLADRHQERVRVVPTKERFLGITYADDVAGVTAEIAALVDADRYPSPLWG